MKKIFGIISILAITLATILSCGKEKSFEATDSIISEGTLKSPSGDCLSAVVSGTFMPGTALDAGNYIDIQVDVTKKGQYVIASNIINGYSFSAEGSFDDMGLNTVRLAGTGVPTSASTNSFEVTYNSTVCVIDVTVPDPNLPPAVFSLGSGITDPCSGFTLSGVYEAGVTMGASNTLTLSVNVTTSGSYTIDVPAVNGITFSRTGVFTATGVQNVTLTASGKPVAEGTHTFTPAFGASACTFDLTTLPAPPVAPGVYTCKIDGVAMTFNDRSSASLKDGFQGTWLFLDGYKGPATGDFVPEFQIFITNNDGSAVKTGTYNVDGFLTPGYRIEIGYHVENPDQSVTIWNTSSSLLSANPPFTIIVSSITATRVSGTFSGKLTNTLEGSTMQKTVTEGTFDLPIEQ